MAAFSFAIALYAAGRLSDELPLGWSLLPGRLVGVIALAIPLVVMRHLNLTRKALPLVLLLGFFEVAGFTFYWFGAQDGVAVTAVLASQFAPIAAVLAFLIFKERLGRLQIVGVAILVAGVTALTLVTG
jgi:drug/metabolite transporter (DMT)-like permease